MSSFDKYMCPKTSVIFHKHKSHFQVGMNSDLFPKRFASRPPPQKKRKEKRNMLI